MKKLTVAWLSAGVSSFIAAYLIRDEIDEFYYIDIDDQHPDSMRFIKDCETALGRPIKILKSNYGSVENALSQSIRMKRLSQDGKLDKQKRRYC